MPKSFCRWASSGSATRRRAAECPGPSTGARPAVVVGVAAVVVDLHLAFGRRGAGQRRGQHGGGDQAWRTKLVFFMGILVVGLRGGRGQGAQPLMPPAVRPEIIHFWASMNTIVMGRPGGWPPRRSRPTGISGRTGTSSSRPPWSADPWRLSRMEATGYSMIAPMKASRNTTIGMGTAIGSSTWRKACQGRGAVDLGLLDLVGDGVVVALDGPDVQRDAARVGEQQRPACRCRRQPGRRCRCGRRWRRSPPAPAPRGTSASASARSAPARRGTSCARRRRQRWSRGDRSGRQRGHLHRVPQPAQHRESGSTRRRWHPGRMQAEREAPVLQADGARG